jgi:hypothetical protein
MRVEDSIFPMIIILRKVNISENCQDMASTSEVSYVGQEISSSGYQVCCLEEGISSHQLLGSAKSSDNIADICNTLNHHMHDSPSVWLEFQRKMA